MEDKLDGKEEAYSCRDGREARQVDILRDIEFDQPGLLDTEGPRRLWPHLKQNAISSHSLARLAVKMMIELCEPWFKQTAEAEQQSPI